MNTGGPAFPLHPEVNRFEPHAGMTLRDYFAAKAMQGMVGNGGVMSMYIEAVVKLEEDEQLHWSKVAELVSEEAYTFADAMLKAREE